MELLTGDMCPYCRDGLQVVCVKFRLSRATMILACPNCAIACADDPGAAKNKGLAATGADAAASRFRYKLAFLTGAAIVAAVLRHSIHIYGGISPEHIRLGTIIFLIAIVWLVLALKKSRLH